MTEFQNRIGGLRFFGVLEIALGVFSGLLAGVSLLSIVMVGEEVGAPGRVMFPAVATYLFVAVYFGCLGVGSFRARRWAQALSLATGWIWLGTGVMAAVSMALVLPRTLETVPDNPAGIRMFVGGCMSAVILVFFILLPVVVVLFYRSPAVRATVERLDPVPRWTDALPISVLAFVVLCGSMGLSSLTYSFVYRALPMGALIIRGPAATAIMIALAAVAFWIAWGSSRLRPSAWWTALALLVLGAVMSFTLLPRFDFAAWYEALDMPMDPAHAALLQDLYASPSFLALMALAWAAYFGWLLWMRRYFFRGRAEPRP